ncbi:MAG: ABC transporter ATP-binding protein [Methylococcales bacterium]|jgi:Cu-processing system ATP-binding protein|nr:ABC transporter ATP-binding protein [Methylococcales bacterium]MBT7409424.1 ABC transporter ATP-binding protein [Methylococcales bacterium]
MSALIQLKNIKKYYQQNKVLENISLDIFAGEHLAIIGNNGQGKTTLIQILLGLIPANEGDIFIQGKQVSFPRTSQDKIIFGYLPENVNFYPNLTARRTLSYFAKLKNVAENQVMELLELVGLAHVADEVVKIFSKGMRQRLGLAQALLGQPACLLLDEPTNGLDPGGIQEFYQTLENLQNQNVAILTVSHLLAEIEPRLDRLALLNDGLLQYTGSISQLTQATDLPSIIKINLQPPQAEKLQKKLQALVKNIVYNNANQQLSIECQLEKKAVILDELMQYSEQLPTLSIRNPDLNSFFHHVRHGN